MIRRSKATSTSGTKLTLEAHRLSHMILSIPESHTDHATPSLHRVTILQDLSRVTSVRRANSIGLLQDSHSNHADLYGDTVYGLSATPGFR